MAERFLNKAISFVTEHKEEPFFLYYALHQPHVPPCPAPALPVQPGWDQEVTS